MFTVFLSWMSFCPGCLFVLDVLAKICDDSEPDDTQVLAGEAQPRAADAGLLLDIVLQLADGGAAVDGDGDRRLAWCLDEDLE